MTESQQKSTTASRHWFDRNTNIESREKGMLIVDQESVFTVNHDWLVHCCGIKEDQSSLSPLDGSGRIRLSKGLTISEIIQLNQVKWMPFSNFVKEGDVFSTTMYLYSLNILWKLDIVVWILYWYVKRQKILLNLLWKTICTWHLNF